MAYWKTLLAFCILTLPALGSAQRLTSYVDPYIGSGGHGHVFVGASVPFGGVQLGPENFYKGWDWCSGYNYGDSVMIGFAHTHLSGTGIGDLADVLIMPYTGPVKIDKGLEKEPGSGYASHYTHKNEQVRPGYYSVKLDDYNIGVELTATERVGFHRYRFPTGKQAHVIIDLKEGINDQATDTYIEQVDEYTFKGYRFSKGWAKDQRQFFAIKSSEPIHGFAVYDGDKLLEGKKGQGKAIKGLISFDEPPATLQLKVGLSPVSAENALDNIAAEIPRWNFDEIARQADEKWNRELSKITIATGSEKEKRIFYTSVFHTMIDPCLFNDHNGDYRGTDKQVYKHAPFANYSVFSTWDTYRAAHSLYILTQPDRVGDMVNSMLAVYDQQGRLPIWQLMGNDTHTMVGISSMQIISEAYLKGIKGFDPERAFADLKATAMGDSLGLMYVKNFKAIPSDKESRSVAKGLEYAIGDGSIALMAERMGKKDDYAYFHKRSENYHLYYDSLRGFFRAKLSDGEWTSGFNPFKAGNVTYAEGNAWQYLWLAPQDVPGLISLLGGPAMFDARLDSFFALATPAGTEGLDDLTGTIGQYAHGNEPSHHIAYLYAYTGEQWKTAEKVRYIMKEMYRDDPDGVIGNEDCGQMSAWNVFSSLGFYPVFPASGIYVFGSPAVDKAVIHLSSGSTFTVEATGNSPENIYIQRVQLNGKEYNKSYLLHSDLVKGGTLRFFMGNKPNKAFGQRLEDNPAASIPGPR
jgi:predicted alpha-1,2-mannosidase